MAHQVRALRLAQHRDQVALFLEMRLGKSLVAIRWAERYAAPRLVVGPLGTLHAWRDELSLEGHPAVLLLGSVEERLRTFHAHSRAHWFLTNYEGLHERGHRTARGKPQAVPSFLAKLAWSVVILDETVCIRNPKAIRTKVCVEHLAHAPHKAILTGLPNPEGPLDFFPQMQFLLGRFMGCNNYWTFRQRFFLPGYGGFSWSPKRGVLAQIKSVVRKHAIIIGREEVGLHNRVIQEKRVLPFTQKLRKAYERIEKNFALGSRETKWEVVVQSWLRQFTGGRPRALKPKQDHDIKLAELRSLLAGELKGQQVLVWFEFLREGRAIEKALREDGLRVRRIVGAVPPKQRHEWCMRFAAGKLDVLCLLTGCAKYGLDLSAASVSITYTEPFSHNSWAQSRDRMIHPKKKEPLLFVSLLIEDTIDEIVYSALRGKRLTSKAFLHNVVQQLRQQWERKYGKRSA